MNPFLMLKTDDAKTTTLKEKKRIKKKKGKKEGRTEGGKERKKEGRVYSGSILSDHGPGAQI